MAEFSVRKPLTVFVGVILVLILGFVSFTNMSTDLLPAMDLPYVMVMTTSVGDSPEKIEKNVTKPLEQQLSTTGGVKEIQSISNENVSMIIMEFYESTDMNAAMIHISSKIDLANLPDEIPNPTIIQINPDMMPIMVGAIDIDNMEMKEVSALAKEQLMPALERVDGVASVTGSGLLEESISISLDQTKIDHLNEQILAQVDSTLAETKGKLDEGERQLASAKKQLRIEEQKQLMNLIEGESTIKNLKTILSAGKEGMDQAVVGMGETMTEIKQKLNEAQGAGIDTSLLEEAFGKANDSYQQLAAGNQKLHQTLSDLNTQENQLNQGKSVFADKTADAYAQIEAGERAIIQGKAAFDTASKNAYQAAGLTSMLSKQSLNQILTAENMEMPAGYLTVDQAATLVKIGDEFKSIEEVKRLTLIDQGDLHITLNDVAEIKIINNAEENFAKINGNDGLLFTIQKQSTASTSEVSKELHQVMEQLQNENKQLHMTVLSDQGAMIEIVVGSVLNNLITGGILAAVILFLFVKDLKTTFITALSIPISLMFAIVLMYFSGVSLNIISLAGLALGVGMLVDNSIVVVENIYRLKAEGSDLKAAAVNGTKQMAGAICASTMTTICVFLPIVFTEGITRQLFTDMGLTIAYSLIASFIVALTLVPALSGKLLNHEKEKPHVLFDRIVNGYLKVLEFCLNKKAAVLSAAVLLFGFSGYMVTRMGTEFIPPMDSEMITATISGNKEWSKAEFRKKVEAFLPTLEQAEGIQTVGVMEGGSAMTASMSSQGNSMSVYLILEPKRSLSSQAISAKINALKPEAGLRINANGSSMDMSALMGSGIQIDIKGQDLDQLQSVAGDIKTQVKEISGIKNASDGSEADGTEIVLHVNKNEAMKHQLTVAQVYAEIAALLSKETKSTSLTDQDGSELPIIISNKTQTESLDQLLEHELTTKTETKVKLKELVSVTKQGSLKSIHHDNQVRTISVNASIKDDANIGIVGKDVSELLDHYELPKGYTAEMNGENETINETLQDLVKMIALAIMFIYLIMVAQFQSLKSPFIVLFTLPLAFTGGLLALLISGSNLSMIAMLGFLILSGIVVNNGIVFVDCVNQLKESGMPQREALLTSGKIRIRPIIMTALTTILGLSTMALGIGSGADMLAPMAIVTIGGLLYATLMTLYVVPCIYDLIHRNKHAALRFAHSLSKAESNDLTLSDVQSESVKSESDTMQRDTPTTDEQTDTD